MMKIHMKTETLVNLFHEAIAQNNVGLITTYAAMLNKRRDELLHDVLAELLMCYDY